MKRKRRRAGIAAWLSSALVGACAAEESGDPPRSACDPTGYLPHAVLELPDAGEAADPHVIKVGDTYYLYPTSGPETYSGNEGFAVWTSRDLETWTHRGFVWQPQSGDFYQERDRCGFWAPNVTVTEEGYWLHYTANCRIGVARSDSPLGPFLDVYDHPMVGNGYGGIGTGAAGDDILDYSELAIDAFVFTDDGGERYLYFTAYSPLSNIHVVPLIDMATVANVSPRPVFAPEPSGWEGAVREGSWVEKRDGRYLLTYSGNMAYTVNYGVGLATSESPLGPFARSPGNPFLAGDMEAGIYGPGHHSFVEGLFDDPLMFYHTKVSPEPGWSRRIRYTPWCREETGEYRTTPF